MDCLQKQTAFPAPFPGARVLTARVLSPTLEAMRPSMVPYSASREVSLSILLRWMRLNTRMATVETTIRMTTGTTTTATSMVTL